LAQVPVNCGTHSREILAEDKRHGEFLVGELTVLVGVEDLGAAKARERFAMRFDWTQAMYD
jgi:hypothetical protein